MGWKKLNFESGSCLCTGFYWSSENALHEHFIAKHMYIQVPLVDHLRPLHKTSGSGLIAHGILRNSTTGVSAHGILKNSTRGIFEDPMRRNSCSGVSEDPHAQWYSTDPYTEWGFWRTGRAETPLPEFLRILCAETPIVEFLRIPVHSDTPPTLIGNEVSSTPGIQKLHYRSFWGSCAQELL